MPLKDLDIHAGSSFEWLALIEDVNGAPLDMTSYTGGTAGARGMIREKYSSTSATKSFTITIINKTGVLAAIAAGTLHLTTAQIAALKSDSFGKCYLLIRLPSADSAALVKKSYVYDIETEDAAGYIPDPKPYWGSIAVTPESTKS